MRISHTIKGEALCEALQFLMTEWNLTSQEVGDLLRLPPETIETWLRERRIPIQGKLNPNVEAVVHLLAVHRNLSAMFSDSKNQWAWLRTQHPELGIVPIDKIRESVEGLILIRGYLDTVCAFGA